jgi:hypothetical protein
MPYESSSVVAVGDPFVPVRLARTATKWWRVTLGDGDFRKSLMKMIYRKLPKIASPPVTPQSILSSSADG